ncbi:coiled-coil domain-containing protein 9 isoform X3 [Pygocentrus nattereri]|uniref:coiled-coil domain-containing protein 9 isoform X3 n=1 Tax=Pygocentrus nattereri TaxID=42514 RepID=UPI001891CD32|nr:coiled-coil domain-containing protein 9 isoform X3 [Pygocentrus nattereri]
MSAVVDLKTKEEKDAELDRRIEALRKKNEALVRRYQEIEEDKKKAEQEGIAVTTTRKPRSHESDSERRKIEKENFTVTVDLSKPSGEKRVVNDRKSGSHHGDHGPEEGDGGQPHGESPPRKTGSGRLNRGGQRGGSQRSERREPRSDKGDLRTDRTPREGEGGEGRPRGGRRGGRGGSQQVGSGSDRKSKEWEEKRRQNIEKMNEEMEKIAEYERGQRTDGEKNPTRNFLDDPRRSGPIPETDRKEGSRRHVRNWGGLDFDNVKTGAEVEKEWTNRRPGGKGSMDMTLSMTGRERAEYLRWKKEREQIDEERLARHRNATGQWRREWDAQKTDTMFTEDPAVVGEGMPEPSSRRAARGRNACTQQRSGASEDSKKPPKAPTFGDFLGQDKPRERNRGGHGRGKGRGQGKSYSMHDNRWEAEKEEEKGKKEELEKEKKEEDKPKTPSEKPADAVGKPVSGGAAEDDDDQWVDASDGEEDDEEKEEEKHQNEERGAQKDSKPTEKAAGSSGPSTPSPKEQRTFKPKVRIPSPQETLSTPEATKPLSPFSPLESHQPVSDWGEEMEMLSPKSSLGESPLTPSSNDSSPAQNKSQEKEHISDATSQHEESNKQDDAQPVVESAAPMVEEESASSEPAAQAADSTISSKEPSVLPAQDSATEKEESAAPTIEPEQKQSGSEAAVDAVVESLDQTCSG